jgi:hypothetical protein
MRPHLKTPIARATLMGAFIAGAVASAHVRDARAVFLPRLSFPCGGPSSGAAVTGRLSGKGFYQDPNWNPEVMKLRAVFRSPPSHCNRGGLGAMPVAVVTVMRPTTTATTATVVVVDGLRRHRYPGVAERHVGNLLCAPEQRHTLRAPEQRHTSKYR